jgi:predicted nucleic acid-binding protein
VTDAILLDTSLALKSVLPEEEDAAQADALFQDSLRAGLTLLIPPLLLIEATNALLRQIRRGRLDPTQASAALQRLLRLPLQQAQPAGIYEQALTFATTHQIRSAYDTLYVVAAQVLGVGLWTAGRNLIDALDGVAPWVHWIGDYPLRPEAGPPP